MLRLYKLTLPIKYKYSWVFSI